MQLHSNTTAEKEMDSSVAGRHAAAADQLAEGVLNAEIADAPDLS